MFALAIGISCRNAGTKILVWVFEATGHSKKSNRRFCVWSAALSSLLFCLTGANLACQRAANSIEPVSGTVATTTTASNSLSIASDGIAEGEAGSPYAASLSASGGTPPYRWRLAAGTLPPGLQLQLTSGVISGMTTAKGTFPFTVEVFDSAGFEAYPVRVPLPIVQSAEKTLVLTVTSALAIVNSQLAEVDATVPYTASLSATGGVPPYQWSLASGLLPSGIQLQGTAGDILGTTAMSGSYSFTAQVADSQGYTASLPLTLTVSPQLTITGTTLPVGNATVPYSATMSATGGVPPYHWSLTSGSLPSGIELGTGTGVISGTAPAPGSYSIVAQVTDSDGNSDSLSFALTVMSGCTSGFDGPAELPRICIQTAMSNTPTPGATINVSAGGDLQSALNGANCGDTIQLQEGASFSGIFTFPAKNCDDNHWIIVRTSADDSMLPAEGRRLTPCYAGVFSLPGRPSFPCSSPTNVLAKLVMTAINSGPIVFAAGANHYRLIGLEITRAEGTGRVSALSSIATGGTANNIIFDRVWLHGTAQDETTRAVALGGSSYFSVIDSYITDCHCIAKTGVCSDSQAISGGLGNSPMGPYKITDDFLEAAGENILFGGGEASVTPADIEITRNHMFKPLTWMQGQAGYVGGSNGNPFVAKNLFELKNAQRVLLDSNLMEYSWGGFSQVGFAVLLTPKNQSSGSNGNLCPSCEVTDVTIRYNHVAHVGAGIQIANGLSDNGGISLAGERYSIHDVIVDDIDGLVYEGPGLFAQVSMGVGSPVLSSVTINHVTAFPPSTLFIIGDSVPPNPQMNAFVFTNSIANSGPYPVWSTGGGTANCAHHDAPLTTLNACFSSYTFTPDAIIATPASSPPSSWPTGNFFPASATTVQFVNYNGGNGGNYSLQPSSPYKGAGTDGKDLGADVDAIDTVLSGVN